MGEAHFEIRPLNEPGLAVAEEGLVLLDGPNGIAVALTPDAATQTGERLIAAARLARRQASEGAA